jgi:hypothetical protein
MSTDKLDDYLKSYSNMLVEIVNLHNLQITYLKYFGRDTGSEVRKQFKKLAKLHKELQKKNLASYFEHRENTKAKLANKRLERAYRKANPKKAGRKKKNEQHNSTTSNGI